MLGRSGAHGPGARTECTVSASDLGLTTEVGLAGEGGSREATLDDARMHGDGITDSGGDGEGQRAGVVCEEALVCVNAELLYYYGLEAAQGFPIPVLGKEQRPLL